MGLERMPSFLYIDVTRLIRRQLQQLKPTGIDRVMLAYVKHYQSSAYAVVYYFGRLWQLSAQQSQQLFFLLLSGNDNRLTLRLFVFRSLRFSLRKKPNSTLLILGHSHLEKKRYIQEVSKTQCTPIFFIHDLIPLTHPEYCRLGENEKHKRRIHHVLDLAKGIIVNSKDTHDRLVHFASSIEKNLPVTCIAPLGTNLPKSSLPGRIIAPPYFVMIGTIEPRKNHIMVLQVWKKLIEQFGDNTPKLILIGRRGWECEHITRTLDRCPTLRGFIQEWSQCPDEELSSCLQHCQALLFPSFVEGYGLPLVEALNAGIPVIASKIAVLQEIGGDVPEYIDPLDSMQWMNTIADYMQQNSVLRQAQQKRLAHYKVPTWESHFLITERFFQATAS